MLTQPFAEALAEAEKLIAGAPFVASEQDLAEGYDYLAGGIQASLRLAWAYQRDFPYFVSSTGPYDGPRAEVVPFTQVAGRLPYFDQARVCPPHGGNASPRARPPWRKGC